MPKLVQIIIGIFFIISNGRLVVKSAVLFWVVEGLAAILRKTEVLIPKSYNPSVFSPAAKIHLHSP